MPGFSLSVKPFPWPPHMEQPGHPLVEARREGDRLELRQKRFTFLENRSAQLWLVPVSVTVFLADVDHRDLVVGAALEQDEQVNVPGVVLREHTHHVIEHALGLGHESSLREAIASLIMSIYIGLCTMCS